MLYEHIYFLDAKHRVLFVKKKNPNAANFIIKGKAHKDNCLFCTYLLMFKVWLHNNGSVLVALLKILCMY